MKTKRSVVSGVIALVVASVVVADEAEKIGQVRFPPPPAALKRGWEAVEKAKAAKAAEGAADRAKAKTYYARLLDTAKAADTQRPELVEAKALR